jgi:hypothetical protein
MPGLYAVPLLSGDAGTSQTIDKIRQLVDDAWKDSSVRRFAFEILLNAGIQPYDKFGQAMAIYNWATSATYYLADPVNKEALMPAVEMLKLYQQLGVIPGDCDDLNTILLPSLLGSVGLEPRIVTIAADNRDPRIFSHIYTEVKVDGDWIPMDIARPGAAFGKAPETFYRRWKWSLVDSTSGPYEQSCGCAECEGMGMLGNYSDPRCQSVLRGTIGPTGIAVAAPQPSGVNVKAIGWIALGIGALLLLTGKVKL